MNLNIALAQFEPSFKILENLQKMLGLISHSSKGDIVVFPEGCLSGYSDNLDFLHKDIMKDIENAITKLQKTAKEQDVHLIFGSCIVEEGNWYNAGFYLSPKGIKHTYKKVNLAYHEREIFKAGDKLSCFYIEINEKKIKCSIQLCREIRFPEQWKFLSLQGSEIFFYLTNTLGPEKQPVWDAHLISRAAENQRYVVSSNITSDEQGCSTMIVSPKGSIIKELTPNIETIERININLKQNSDWYLTQSRTDLLKIVKM
ncbi:carbon-nitrogen hydrolase family protein (plasmid) [Cytobacillus spongiae]|uniref:carbon-nitrogen hydrolase family protein n=1 Tax=Cytobacillus spongiae TaxID=2901381 RepID=UPI001F3B418D|nr:carbon-nitrogen hydrolase family protein [Cytobacillus spongiae]UII58387.1 carbon-nitrogen hydrolase family protein [Cytobacillus spongiae]